MLRSAHYLFVAFFGVLLACQDAGKVNEVAAAYLLKDSDLPEYEKSIDHDSLITALDRNAFRRGMIIYRTTCFTCHGDEEQPGSLPNSIKFWSEPFKNGSDPFALYQTITKGFGLMPPQVHLVPKQKYDVIHFIRESFIKKNNPKQYVEADSLYVMDLPKGDELGPDPKPYRPWADMDYGNWMSYTFELADSLDPPRVISGGRAPLPNEDYSKVNFAYKGVALRLDPGNGGVAAGEAFLLFDLDLMRVAGAWTGKGFIDYEGILLNDAHNIYPRTVGHREFQNPVAPGWANPKTGRFADPRFKGYDGRPFGPLPRDWTHFKGLYRYEDRTVFRYTVGDAMVLETFDLEQKQNPAVFSRTLNISASSRPLKMRVAPIGNGVSLVGGPGRLAKERGFTVLNIPAGREAKVKLLISGSEKKQWSQLAKNIAAPADLKQYTQGSPAQLTQKLSSPIIPGNDEDAYAMDVFVLPMDNPWKSRLRLTGIDFLPGGDEAVVSTVDGEIYRLQGITQKTGNVSWTKIASGMFQPLGIKYQNGDIYVGCRDQIVKLVDLNGDGETDYYESFNNDHQVTEHYHEFAMGLQTDDFGNFYYAKSARHARKALIPRHGTLIKVSPDGSKSEVIAHGFRAANGVCLNPDGSFYVTDQEGHWNPMNRINRVTEGGFYGNMFGGAVTADSSDEAMIKPMFWVDMKYDRSPAELLWADSDRWGPLNGSLINLSYGYGKIFLVLPQDLDNGLQQGGMVELPVPQVPTGIMRARFNPKDGQFYGCGMSAWATNQMLQVGGLYRVRYTGKSLHLPVKMEALPQGIRLAFSSPLRRKAVENIDNFTINTWDLKRTRRYGSDRYNNKQLQIEKVVLEDDGKTLMIYLPEIKPTWVMEILYKLRTKRGKTIEGAIQNSIHQLENVDT